MKNAVVIGAGIGGIAAALRLSKKGYNVTVFEANDYPGGKLSAFSLGDYRFDAGPSLFTMPQYVTELFEIHGEKASDFFTYQKKKIACQYFWEDQTQLTAYADSKLFLQEVHNKLGVKATVLEKYLKRAKKKFELTAPLFLEQSLHKFKGFLSVKTLKALLNLSLYEINQNLHTVNAAQLKEPHLVQMYDRYATYNGSSPYQTPGIMTLVQHLEQEFGTFVPDGGMEQITQSLFELAKRKGVSFHLGEKVSQILVENGKATGIKTKNHTLLADIVLSNMDVFPTYKNLLKGIKAPQRILSQERSSSAVIFYWGINKIFDQLDLHNIFFSQDYKSEFEAIFNQKKPSEDFTVYVNITSKDIPSDAPKGAENWFVMINTPADHGQDWNQIKNELRKKTIAKLNRILKVDMDSLIQEEEVLTPPMIEHKTSSHLGALYGSSSNDKMAAFLRHPNFSSKIKNLYFCGGSVHPGGGIPLCLLSAKIATDLIP
ncbi:phytoene desaturase family protein [Flavobacteriaceae bacterium]|nr:phytoene desaturase family protein [Flavobacteriaceae bacterium]MDC0479032.1 phytoene desaturase family protein [Flavobacteriaceae bacterium]